MSAAAPRACAYQRCALAAQFRVVISMPNAVVWDLEYCAAHAGQVTQRLPMQAAAVSGLGDVHADVSWLG